jgi:hypothetical protein
MKLKMKSKVKLLRKPVSKSIIQVFATNLVKALDESYKGGWFARHLYTGSCPHEPSHLLSYFVYMISFPRHF